MARFPPRGGENAFSVLVKSFALKGGALNPKKSVRIFTLSLTVISNKIQNLGVFGRAKVSKQYLRARKSNEIGKPKRDDKRGLRD